jgi:predicted flap endonuclease-1-like 5' DNA nuclease
MGFFLSKTWPWWLLAAGLAVLVAWLIHRRSPSATTGSDQADCGHEAELATLRGRVKTLEGDLAGNKVVAAAPVAAAPVAAAPVAAAPVAAAPVAAAPVAAVPVAEVPEAAVPMAAVPLAAVPVVDEAVPDVAEGAKALGFPVKLDDLKVVEGIGPKIEGLLHADGIKTWRALSEAPAERLKGILDAAGPRYRVHNPTSWPQQAKMLVSGEWTAFKKLTDELTAGRE